MSNVAYRFEGDIGYGTLADGTTFLFSADKIGLIKDRNWYRNYNNAKDKILYISDHYGKKLHDYLVKCPNGYEVDHINLDTLDNRDCNLRFVTHQQNQINQPLQKNNTSGVSGVSFYPPRRKYRARIKIGQHDIHLGYYATFEQAVQARNVGMECMFGEYGRYNDVSEASMWVRQKVIEKCKRFAELSVCKAFQLSVEGDCA